MTSKLIRHFQCPAFTLAELLIALAILAIIVTFTIPKILASQNDEKRKALFKETIAALNEATYTGVHTQGLVKGASFWNDDVYLANALNAYKKCNNASTGGAGRYPNPVEPTRSRRAALSCTTVSPLQGLDHLPSSRSTTKW